MKLKKRAAALLGAVGLAVSLITMAPAANAAQIVPATAASANTGIGDVTPSAGNLPCDGTANVRFSQSGGWFRTSTIKNCRNTTVKVRFIGNNAVTMANEYSSCRTLAPGASTSVTDSLAVYWHKWSYC